MADIKRILIVDDNPRVLQVLCAIVNRLSNGVQIVTAASGRDALVHVKSEPFDLVITDVKMPGIDGIRLAEDIRALSKHTTMIWITAYGCERLQADCERLCIYRCLEKPLRIEQIRRATLDALEAHAGQEHTDD